MDFENLLDYLYRISHHCETEDLVDACLEYILTEADDRDEIADHILLMLSHRFECN